MIGSLRVCYLVLFSSFFFLLSYFFCSIGNRGLFGLNVFFLGSVAFFGRGGEFSLLSLLVFFTSCRCSGPLFGSIVWVRCLVHF